MRNILIKSLDVIIIMVVTLTFPAGGSAAFTIRRELVSSEIHQWKNKNSISYQTGCGITSLVSLASDGTQADDGSYGPAISANGRFVAFHSSADNLVSDDTNNESDVFLHDTHTGETTRVSINSEGVEGNGGSYSPAISTDGQFVAFTSNDPNLVSDDTNGDSDTFLHDTRTGKTTRVSLNSDGVEGNSGSNSPAISADGQFVTFYSGSTNLVNDDTNDEVDVFLHDTHTGETTRVSINSEGVEGNAGSYGPAISSDGRYIAFQSRATNLVSDDTNDELDVFLHDTHNGETTRVSLSSDGVEGNGESRDPAISADGRFVGFQSHATSLVKVDTNDRADVYLHDTRTGETTRVSINSEGVEGNWGSYIPAISADGRFVAFQSSASNLVSNDTNYSWDIFIHDTRTGKTTRVSINSEGVEGNEGSTSPAISADGQFVAFSSPSTNLVNVDTNHEYDVFLRERNVVCKIYLPSIFN